MDLLLKLMIALHDSEINSGVQLFWDDCVTIWIGDDINGKEDMNCETKHLQNGDGAKWLFEDAIKKYPTSKFARLHASLDSLA